MLNDGLYHISLMGGQARAILIESTNLVQRAKDIHHLSRTATAALGRTLTMAAIMGSMLKNDTDSVTAQIARSRAMWTIRTWIFRAWAKSCRSARRSARTAS